MGSPGTRGQQDPGAAATSPLVGGTLMSGRNAWRGKRDRPRVGVAGGFASTLQFLEVASPDSANWLLGFFGGGSGGGAGCSFFWAIPHPWMERERSREDYFRCAVEPTPGNVCLASSHLGAIPFWDRPRERPRSEFAFEIILEGGRMLRSLETVKPAARMRGDGGRSCARGCHAL